MFTFTRMCLNCQTELTMTSDEIHEFNPSLTINGIATEEELAKLSEIAKSKGKKCFTCPICDAEIFLTPTQEAKKSEQKSEESKVKTFTSVKK